MASLVADYSDSESEEECFQDSKNTTAHLEVKIEIKEEYDKKDEIFAIKEENLSIKEEVTDIKQESVDIKQEPDPARAVKTVTNFFIASDNACDDDEEEEKDSKTNIKAKERESIKSQKLPNPLDSQKLPSINDASSLMTGASVFINAFKKEELAKNQILERHVRLTEAAPKKPAHQPMCWKFKKGKCHLGKNCRFFHDRDVLSNEDSCSGESSKTSDPSHTTEKQRSTYHPAAYRDAQRRPLEVEPVDDDNYLANMKKKKRFGINDALMPPKKAYESLLQMRQKERPWTLPNAHS